MYEAIQALNYHFLSLLSIMVLKLIDQLWEFSRPVKGVTQTSAGVDKMSNAVTRLDITADIDSKAETIACHQTFPSMPECKCGMPLCICEAPAHPGDAFPQQV